MIALLLCTMLLVAVSAVDRSKFKKCGDSGFCRRNRALADNVDAKGGLDASPFRFSGLQTSSSSVVFDVDYLASSEDDPKLIGQWSFFSGGSIARLTIKEKHPLYSR